MTDRFDLIRFSLLPRVGGMRARNLLRHFRSFSELTKAGGIDLLKVEGIDKTLAAVIREAVSDEDFLRDVEKEIARTKKILEKKDVQFVTYLDNDYPEPLRRIYDAPLYLFISGKLPAPGQPAIAVVGTRSASTYGKKACRRITRDLVAAGVAIISGLARGIDTVAHRTALEHDGVTCAVLGSGLDNIYPGENRTLAQDMTARGAVLTEQPFGAKPDAVNFPRRNRIISGLSMGVLVIESAEKGGALLTAQFALDQGKDVFAVPGSIFDTRSSGTNKLIQSGSAKLVRDAEDILAELPLASRSRKPKLPPPQLSLQEEQILSYLDSEPVHIDALAQKTGSAPTDLLVTLLQMEFKGLARQLPGKYFVKEAGP
ncbi:MAG: DNA-protecting protein DprA [Chlorobi bacterium]|nr:DNA-protecting protein DprA [Chlorobiota bacterium]